MADAESEKRDNEIVKRLTAQNHEGAEDSDADQEFLQSLVCKL